MTFVPLDELNLLHSKICQSMGDPRRIQIIYMLHGKGGSVSALADDLEMPRSTVSRHLSILRQSGLVSAEREGTSVVYRLADDHIIDILNLMRQVLRDSLERQSSALE